MATELHAESDFVALKAQLEDHGYSEVRRPPLPPVRRLTRTQRSRWGWSLRRWWSICLPTC